MSYRIQSGDTLSSVANKFGTSVDDIVKANPQIKNPNLVTVGEQLSIPGQKDDYVGSAAAVPAQDLQQGDSGSGVQQLQGDLVKLGYLSQADMNTGPGTFGPHTLSAVKAFQSAKGVPATGYYGPMTRAALAKALGSSAPAPSNPTPAPTQPPATPAPAPSGVPASNLQRGAQGDDVKELQSDLVKLGYMTQAQMNTGPGIFGPQTQASLQSFQSAYGVSATGTYGPQTRDALSRALAGAKPVSQPPTSPSGKTPADIAKQYLGESEYQLQPSGALDMDQWVPKNVDCANFVSGCVEAAGEITHAQRSDNVTGLANNLRAAGWQQSEGLASAKPGDVVCIDGPDGNYQHVEIFAGMVNGKPQLIGSNNILSDGTQAISYDTGSWAYRFHVFHKPD